MLNTLSAPTFDPAGYIELDVQDDTTFGATARRVNRVATIDGAAAFNDFGYSEADRTIELSWPRDDAALEAAVDRMVQIYPRIQVGTAGGVYMAAPETYTPGASESSLRLLVVAKLSA